VLPLTTSRAQENTIPATTSSPAQSARRIYDAICAAAGSNFSPFALETTGGHGASTATVYFLFTKQLRESGLPAGVLVGKLKKDISFALRRTIAPSDYSP
jgi:hypothetical protein